MMNALLDEYCEHRASPGEDVISFVADTTIPKFVVTNEALEVVRIAFDVIGGSGVRGNSRIGQIYRDVRAGTLVPFNNDLSRELVGKAALGIDPMAKPRWL